jgi:hypothetical protein
MIPITISRLWRFVSSKEKFPISKSTVVIGMLSLAIQDQLHLEIWGRKYVICDPEIHFTDFSIYSSRLGIFLKTSDQKSFIQLSRRLRNVGLE